VRNISKAVAAGVAAVAIWCAVIGGAQASQNSCILPNTGTVSGLTLVNDANACINSLLSLYSGASAPGTPTTGMLWYNTTTNYIQQFDGTSWINLWYVDATNHQITVQIGGGITSSTLASAATVDLGSINQSFVGITGTTTITSFGSSATTGTIHIVKFSGILTLTYNATSLILQSGFNITTAAGDTAIALYLGGGNWQVISYIPASGNAVTSSFPLGTVLFGDYATVPAKFVYGFGQALTRTSFPAYLAAVARAQSGTLASGNATITAIGNTAGFAVGMPVEGSSGIGAACTIASFVANTSITLNSSGCVTANGSVTVTVFLTGYGSGGSGSTVGVKDCRGRVVAGRDDLGGTAASRLTTGTGNFGLATGNNLTGGAQSFTILTTNLPAYTPSGTVAISGTIAGSTSPGSITNQFSFGNGSSSSLGFNGSGSLTGTAQGGTSTPFGLSQPTVISDCIVAVLP
jgi:hypothetical protein